VSAAFTDKVLGTAKPRQTDLRVLDGFGHMLFHDHLDGALPVLVDWLHATLQRAPEPVGSAAG
jgi:hypothetical protein